MTKYCKDLLTSKFLIVLRLLFLSQFLPNVCKQIKGHTKPDAYAVSLIKGLSEKEDGTIELVSDLIRNSLCCSTAVLMGANLAHEVSKEYYCEATVGCSDTVKGQELKKIMQVSASDFL